jgi:hypothetical protein
MPVNGIWIPVHFVMWNPLLRIRIRMFFGLLDPDPLVTGADPVRLRILLSSISLSVWTREKKESESLKYLEVKNE